eukprot:5097706-Prymnesium_polylepis.1
MLRVTTGSCCSSALRSDVPSSRPSTSASTAATLSYAAHCHGAPAGASTHSLDGSAAKAQ